MKVTKEQLALLKKHGFMWLKDGCTDKVDASCIADVLPAKNGFKVVYTDDFDCVLKYTTAKVESIEFPENLETTWIAVNWIDLTDIRMIDTTETRKSKKK